ncbi:MAG: hypothetical protein V1711_00250, partial [bacterium]
MPKQGGKIMEHSNLCKPHKTFLGRVVHFLTGPHKGKLRERSEYDGISFNWNFGPWEMPNRSWIDVSKKITPGTLLALQEINGVARVELKTPYKII